MRGRLGIPLMLAVVLIGGVAAGQRPRSLSPRAVLQASQVTVVPVPTPPLPEGATGIAARYPGDVGIENDPDVLFVESFEDSVDAIGRQMGTPSFADTPTTEIWPYPYMNTADRG